MGSGAGTWPSVATTSDALKPHSNAAKAQRVSIVVDPPPYMGSPRCRRRETTFSSISMSSCRGVLADWRRGNIYLRRVERCRRAISCDSSERDSTSSFTSIAVLKSPREGSRRARMKRSVKRDVSPVCRPE